MKIRIAPLGKSLRYGFYVIQRQKKFLCFPYWENINEFLGTGIWNPVLRLYSDAVILAQEFTDESKLNQFIIEQREKASKYESMKKKPVNLYPVDEEIFE
jgi:hypothetical protein